MDQFGQMQLDAAIHAKGDAGRPIRRPLDAPRTYLFPNLIQIIAQIIVSAWHSILPKSSQISTSARPERKASKLHTQKKPGILAHIGCLLAEHE
jgi:hypothetical protein